MFGAREGSVDRIKQALADGARCNADSGGLTPLKIAALYRHADCVRVLIQAERDQAPGAIKAFSQRVARAIADFRFQRRRNSHQPEHSLKHSRRSALLQAAQGGSTECVLQLIEHNDPKASDLDGHTPLMAAAFSGHLDAIRALLPHSDPLATDRCGRDALTLAVEGESLDAALLLLPVSDPRRIIQTPGSHFGLSALWIAASRQLPELVRLLAPVSDLAAVDSYGRDALSLATRSLKPAILDPIARVSSLAALNDSREALLIGASFHPQILSFALPRLNAHIEERQLGVSVPLATRLPASSPQAKSSRRL